MPIAQVILKALGKAYAFLCGILHWAGPVLLVCFLLSTAYIHHQNSSIQTLEVKQAQIESDLKFCLEDAAVFKKQALDQQKKIADADAAKKANTVDSCKSKVKIATSAVAIKPETNLLEQELPDDLIKEIDPSYSPKP